MKIAWTKLALGDIQSAYEYIAKESPANASLVIERVQQAIQNLEKHPEMGRPGRIAGTRELVLLKTPFILPYRITEDRIEILAFIHAAQKWPDRL